MKPSPLSAAAPIATVDAQNPWLGLVSFTEETRNYFHGREEEAAELGRRVQRKLLTVLFGQSGLGKTSILQAGLVPRLRPEGFCPVYVRLDYDPHSPPPAEQIKRAVFRATEAAGKWTKSGSSTAGESLWEFLHHRDDVLQDAHGRPLVPLLIFDQFEEIFTLAQSDDAGRQRAQEFIQDLADLVENRPPASLEARIDRDEADAARFDFARADYRILISLREDYLAHLEGLKDRMPSVTQNRMRLARMHGAQALSAVRRPAPELVSEAVAESIVRFVAGGAALAVAEVEPSLLSLICRELNNTRLARGHAEISADLLAGSRDTILSEFYERALADQPAGVRAFIEDEMLTDSGFRESVGEERVRKAFAAAGAPDGALAQLVDRRLLRAEDRLDQRRVEITHDVLCSVIVASRNVRRERDALAESERQLAAQREREAATRRQLTRARLVAAVAVVLMLGAAGSAVFGFLNLRRARAAEQAALGAEQRAAHIGQLADSARGEAEKIVGYLVDDFYRELEPTGRVEIVAQLAARAAEYYRNLPAELRTRETIRNHGLTLARWGAALNSQNRTDDANRVLAEAIDILDRLRREGDTSTETAAGFALALRNQGSLLSNQQLQQQSLETHRRAVDALRPLASAPGATRNLRLDYGQAMHDYAVQQNRTATDGAERGLPIIKEAYGLAQELIAKDPKDTEALALLALVTVRQAAFANALGHPDDGLRLAREAAEHYEGVLRLNPGYLTAINGLGIVHGMMSNALVAQGKLSESLTEARLSEQHYENYVRLNPAGGNGWANLTSARERTSGRLRGLGRVTEAVDKLRSVLEIEQHVPMSSALANAFSRVAANLAISEAELGRTAQARQVFQECARFLARSARDEGQEGITRAITPDLSRLLELYIERGENQRPPSLADTQQILTRNEALQTKDDFSRAWKSTMVFVSANLTSDLALRERNWAQAERGARAFIANLLEAGIRNTFDRRDLADAQVDLAYALARQGRLDEARRAFEAPAQFFAETQERFAESQFFVSGSLLLEITRSYLVPDAAARRAALERARVHLSHLTPEFRRTPDSQLLIRHLEEAEAALRGD
jgi:tetratricopeptide (TPR) repeat protein